MTAIVLALALALQPGPVSAAEPPEVVVEGVRGGDRQIHDFVGALTRAPVQGQLSRFQLGVCPAVVGVTPATSAAIIARMRRVAAATGIKVAPAGCAPNALVLVARDKSDLITGLYRRFPDYFTGMSRGEVRRLAAQPGPAAAWQVEGRLDHDGLEVPRDLLSGYYVHETTDAPSHLTPSTRPHFLSSVLVVELRSLAGLTPTQVADYAAMRTFARTDPAQLRGSATPTILTILDAPIDSAVPLTLTRWDMEFLSALYRSGPGRQAGQQRGEIESLVRRGLDRRRGEADPRR